MISTLKGLKGIFVAGTSTGVGKSFLSALIISVTQGTYWKPIQSGIEDQTDRQWLKELTGLRDDHFLPEAYLLTNPCSPHLSAMIDGQSIDLTDMVLPKFDYSPLVVEGAGGIMVPLNEKDLMLDLMKHLGFPVILVATNQLGTINHTLLSLSVLRQAKLEVLGVILNGPSDYDNKSAIEQFGSVHVIAEINWLEDMAPMSLLFYGQKILGC